MFQSTAVLLFVIACCTGIITKEKCSTLITEFFMLLRCHWPGWVVMVVGTVRFLGMLMGFCTWLAPRPHIVIATYSLPPHVRQETVKNIEIDLNG